MGGGVMGELIRSRDWSSSAMGPRERWPQSLRTAICLVVQSSVPMGLLWGPDLLMFYNDARLKIHGDRHPRMLGQPLRDAWPEIWRVRQLKLAAVMNQGESFLREDMFIPVPVDGQLQNLYFAVGDSPIRIEDGSVGGVLLTFQETTGAVARRKELERTNERLHAIRARLEATLESMTDAVWTTTADGTVLDFNEAFAKYHRFSRKQECPSSAAEYADILELFQLDGTPIPVERRPIPNALQGITATNVEYMLRRKDTGETWFGSYSSAPIRNAEGEIIGAVAVARDITDKKRAEEALLASEQKYWTIFDKAPYAFAMCALPGGEFVEANDTLLQILENKREELIGQTLWSVGISTTEGRKQLYEELALRGHMRDLEYTRRMKSGKVRIFSLNADLITIDGRPYLLLSGQEVTARHEAEEAKVLYQHTKELDEIKTQFFSNVSHELRTPLALILGPTEQLLQASDTPPHISQQLEVVSRNAKMLLGYVNNLLDVAKLEAGHMKAEYDETDLSRIVRLVASLFDVLAHERKIEFVLHVPERLVAQVDPEKIRRILLNLLSNAFHYAPSGGRVRLTLRETAERFFIEVADSGPGIPVAWRQSMFARFGTSHSGGAGLGLFVCREFTVLHGGSISTTDAPEGGALFVVDLPRKAPAGTLIHPDADEPRNRGGPMPMLRVSNPRPVSASATSSDGLVLVIEDNPEMNRFIADSLSNRYRVEVAFDGREGFEKATALKPDLILCDLMMPLISGEDLVQKIRSDPDLEKTPIVVLSAKADKDARIRLLRNGAQDFVTKPFHVEELRVRVRNLVKDKRIEDAQRVLAEFGAALASLDQEKTLHELVQVVVRSFADYAHLYLLEEDGRTKRIASASRDPAFQWCAEVLGIAPSDNNTPHPTLTTVAGQRPILQQFSLDGEMFGLRPEDRQQLRSALPRSVMGVPLLIGDRCLGALMVWSVSRIYGASDLQLLEELGRRCAFYVENARLHREQELATQARNEVLSIVAHDLRNPLASIVLEAGTVQMHAATSKPVIRAAAESIEQSALRMNRIIQDLLDVARLESGRLSMHHTPLPAANVIKIVMAAHRRLAEQASLRLQVDIAPNLPPIRADQHRLVQVFENLLGNAIKFTKPGGEVTVRAIRHNTEVLFSVSDNGIGISEKDIPHVFDRFWRVDKLEKHGAGLGLAIVKGIIEAHDGRIWVESKPGEGSTFYFTVPIANGGDTSTISRSVPPSSPVHRATRRSLHPDDAANLSKSTQDGTGLAHSAARPLLNRSLETAEHLGATTPRRGHEKRSKKK